MNINLTLFGQMITFSLFVWFTMKYVWPPIIQALAERQKKIADGLAAAERSEHELEITQRKVAEQLRETKKSASEIIEKANKQASFIIEEAKGKAHEEGQRLIAKARVDIEKEVSQAKHSLRQHVADIAIAGAERIIRRSVDKTANAAIMNELIEEL